MSVGKETRVLTMPLFLAKLSDVPCRNAYAYTFCAVGSAPRNVATSNSRPVTPIIEAIPHAKAGWAKFLSPQATMVSITFVSPRGRWW